MAYSRDRGTTAFMPDESSANVIAQLVSTEGDTAGPQLDLPVAITPAQLEAVLHGLLPRVSAPRCSPPVQLPCIHPPTDPLACREPASTCDGNWQGGGDGSTVYGAHPGVELDMHTSRRRVRRERTGFPLTARVPRRVI
jgi:hypothetical protein